MVDTWDTQAAFLGLTVFMAMVVALGISLWSLSERRYRGIAPAAVESVT
jgi:hypothetical protein